MAKLLWQKTEMVTDRKCNKGINKQAGICMTTTTELSCIIGADPQDGGMDAGGSWVLQCMGASLLLKLCLTNCFHGIIIHTSPVFPVALFLMVSGIVCAIFITLHLLHLYDMVILAGFRSTITSNLCSLSGFSFPVSLYVIIQASLFLKILL
jgi:hypothetical protein